MTHERLPELQPVPEIGRYRLTQDWPFEARGFHFAIPAGYPYDGASVPRGAWYTTYSPYNPVVMVAALEHDWLCDQRPSIVRYKAAASHFRVRLIHATPLKRELMYQAVLRFGPRW